MRVGFVGWELSKNETRGYSEGVVILRVLLSEDEMRGDFGVGVWWMEFGG